MPFTPDRLVYEAFRTPAGLDPQDAFEHANAYAQQQAQAAQLDRRTNGEWRNVPYSAGLFSANGGPWIVPRATCYVYCYRLMGPELHLRFTVAGSLPVAVYFPLLVLPEGLRVKRGTYADSAGWGSILGLGFATLQIAYPGSHYLGISRATTELWPAGSAFVRGTAMLEVE